MPHTARHALPRARRTALLPALLILAVGSALAGMAALPSRASAEGTQPAALAPAAQDEAAVLSQAVAQERQDERASRDRLPAPMPVPPPPPPAVAPPPAPLSPEFVRPGTGRLTSGYGTRWGRLHAGIDLAAGVGAPISAVAAGTVVTAGSEGGYGRLVRLRHDDGTVTLYAHLSEVLVQPGQRVTAGTDVGQEGSSGHSTGPHLHFEVRVGGLPVDPEPWLIARGVDPAGQ